MPDTPSLFVGIDVSKDWFDVAVRPTAEAFRLAQDEAGMASLVERLQALRPCLVVLEATGGYETLLVAVLGTAAIPVAVVNPRQVRDFAKALGLDFDASAVGLGTRSKRYAMVVDDGVIKTLLVEDAPGQAEKSSAQAILATL